MRRVFWTTTGFVAVVVTVALVPMSPAVGALGPSASPPSDRLLVSGSPAVNHLGWVREIPPAVLVGLSVSQPDNRVVHENLSSLDHVPSPDGRTLASTRVGTGGSVVILRPVGGGAARTAGTVSRAGIATVLDWAADSSALLLSVTEPGVPARLVAMTLPGGALKPLVGDVHPDPRTARFDPADPSRVYTVAAALDTYNEVYRLSTSEQPVVLVPGQQYYIGTITALAVSPDGTRFAAGWDDRMQRGDLLVWPSDGGPPRVLVTVDRFVIGSVTFSTDGGWIYFTAGPDGQRDIYRVPADGTGAPERLTRTPYFDELRITAMPGRARDPDAPHGLTARPAGRTIFLSWPRPVKALEGRLKLRRFSGIGVHGPGVPVRLQSPVTARDQVTVGRVYTYRLMGRDAQGQLHGPALTTVTATASPQLRTPVLASDQGTSPGYRISWATPANRPDTWYSVGNAEGGEPMTEGAATTMVIGPRFGSELRSGETDRWQAFALDRYGNATPRNFSTTVIPTDDKAASRSAGWERVTLPGAWHGSLIRAEAKGARAGFTVKVAADGVQRLWIIGEKGPGHGKMEVFVDDRQVAEVDTRATGLHERRWLWTATRWMSAGTHRISVRVLGTPSRPTIGLDAFAVRPARGRT